MSTLFPWPDRLTIPAGCKTSVERFAQNDLVWRFLISRGPHEKISVLIGC
jgi:hypothetical protein